MTRKARGRQRMGTEDRARIFENGTNQKKHVRCAYLKDDDAIY